MSIEKVTHECCGCRTCKTVCNLNAISVELDKYGFEYMRIDYSKCVECGKCETVCPVLHHVSNEGRISCGAAYAIDNTIKHNGSSGGLFGVFAKEIIKNKGVVFGAAFDENLQLKTTSAESVDDLIPLYKSKYLLCDTDNQFITIREQLNADRQVLYCASPCQVAALKLFLGREYDNLITVDFVCHGVGSQSLFDKSIAYTEKKKNVRIKEVVFRYKVSKASSHYYYYYYYYEKNKRFYTKEDLYLSFPYYNAYCKQLVCRESCYNCRYATENRASDITIGDFHTIDQFDSTIDRFAGVSMFVCNTVKGNEFFELVKKQLFVKLFSWETLRDNNRFNGESGAPALQEPFMESVSNEPFEKTVARFLKPSRDWKRLLYYKAPAVLRNFVRKNFGE